MLFEGAWYCCASEPVRGCLFCLCWLGSQSVALRIEYARAAAEVCKIAKTGTLRRYVDAVRDLHNNATDDTAKFVAGVALSALATATTDKLQKHMPELVPMAFMVRSVCLSLFLSLFVFVFVFVLSLCLCLSSSLSLYCWDLL